MSGRDLSRAAWRKSSRSGATNNCVEVADVGGRRVAVRDSKHPDGPALTFTPAAWRAFVTTAKTGALDPS
ncbi:MAG: DUF397 domain-containing protein [Streptosporangiaceae bacterium]